MNITMALVNMSRTKSGQTHGEWLWCPRNGSLVTVPWFWAWLFCGKDLKPDALDSWIYIERLILGLRFAAEAYRSD